MATPYVFNFEAEVSSTQDLARQQYAGRPVVWMAERQTDGRGRSGSAWLTADEALAVSVALEPEWPVEQLPVLSLVAGLSASLALEHRGATGVRLKWPNDLLGGRGKIGGILAEVVGEIAVVGMGLNLYWPQAPDGMAGLWQTPPAPGFRKDLGLAFVDEFLLRCSGDPQAWGLDEYRERCQTIGRDIVWQPGGRGRAVDIGTDGALIVDAEGQRHELRSGEVWEVRPAG